MTPVNGMTSLGREGLLAEVVEVRGKKSDRVLKSNDGNQV
jgi:hypothetical protein